MVTNMHSELLRTILGVFYDVYNRLGYGFLEIHYAAALERDLRRLGRNVSREHAVQVAYKGEEIGFHRLDMVVDSAVVVELKSTPTLPPIARRQLYNYLRATNLETGLLLYFGPEPRFQKVFVFNRRGPSASNGLGTLAGNGLGPSAGNGLGAIDVTIKQEPDHHAGARALA